MTEVFITHYDSDFHVTELYNKGWRIAHAVFDPNVGDTIFVFEREAKPKSPNLLVEQPDGSLVSFATDKRATSTDGFNPARDELADLLNKALDRIERLEKRLAIIEAH